jgi:hypothetical protein
MDKNPAPNTCLLIMRQLQPGEATVVRDTAGDHEIAHRSLEKPCPYWFGMAGARIAARGDGFSKKTGVLPATGNKPAEERAT